MNRSQQPVSQHRNTPVSTNDRSVSSSPSRPSVLTPRRGTIPRRVALSSPTPLRIPKWSARTASMCRSSTSLSLRPAKRSGNDDPAHGGFRLGLPRIRGRLRFGIDFHGVLVGSMAGPDSQLTETSTPYPRPPPRSPSTSPVPAPEHLSHAGDK